MSGVRDGPRGSRGKDDRGSDICVYPRRIPGHYDNYTELLRALLGAGRVDHPVRQVARVLSYRTIIFLDATYQLLFLPFLLLRSLLGKNNVFIVMRSRFVKSERPHHRWKRRIYQFLRRWTRTWFVSIDRRARDPEMELWYDLFIDDLQLWDLDHLSFEPEEPKELAGRTFDRPVLLVPGGIDGDQPRMCPDELLTFLDGYDGPVRVLVAGRVRNCDPAPLERASGVTLIPRWVSDGELMYLYDIADAVLCYYSLDTDQPSGIFGRAVQKGKWAVVRRGSYVDRHYDYPRTISVASLDEVPSIPDRMDPAVEVSLGEVEKYDSGPELKRFLEEL